MMDHTWHMDFEGFLDRDIPRDHLKDAAGRFRTNIFYDFNKSRHEDYPPIYTMREGPFNGLPSAYLIYMYSDSEYEAALKLVGSWQHWLKLLKSGPFVNGQDAYSQWLGLQAWRDEKEIMDKATAYLQLQVQAGQGSVPAQKIISIATWTTSRTPFFSTRCHCIPAQKKPAGLIRRKSMLLIQGFWKLCLTI